MVQEGQFRQASHNISGSVADRPFHTHDTLPPDLLMGRGPVLMVSGRGTQAARLRAWVEKLGAVGVILDDHRLAVIRQATNTYQISRIVLDEDYLGVTDTLRAIRHIRKVNGEMAVIALSRHVMRRQFDRDHAWSVDAILTMPISRNSMKLGIVSSIANRGNAQTLLLSGNFFLRTWAASRIWNWIGHNSGRSIRRCFGDVRL